MMADTKRFAAIVLAGVMVASVAGAQDIDWKEGKLAKLASTIGTYRYDEVLRDATVSRAIESLVPLATVKKNLETRLPIDFIDGYLVLSGNAPHTGGEEAARVWIKIYDGKAYVALQQHGKWTLYANESRYGYLPEHLRVMIANRSPGGPSQPPADVRWIHNP